MTKAEIDELREVLGRAVLHTDFSYDPDPVALVEEWLDRKEPEGEYTAACVELVERLAGLPLGAEVYRCATHAREIVARKPTSAEAQGE